MTFTASQSTAITSCVRHLLLLAARSHDWHLKTTSYAQHMALGELYPYCHDAADRLAETAMGAGYIPPTPAATAAATFTSPSTAIPGIEAMCKELEDLQERVRDNAWYANIVQEVQGSLYGILYKLKRLS